MIAHLTGRVTAKSASSCVVTVGGFGLRLFMSTNALAHLPAEGDDVTVFTHLHVREDELTLFGFESEEEQEVFERLITVSGVGPKVALSALSALSPAALAEAIAREDDALIATVPGIGRKTAQRLIVEWVFLLSAGGPLPEVRPPKRPTRSARWASARPRWRWRSRVTTGRTTRRRCSGTGCAGSGAGRKWSSTRATASRSLRRPHSSMP